MMSKLLSRPPACPHRRTAIGAGTSWLGWARSDLLSCLSRPAGMKAVFHAGEARITVLAFGSQVATLLAWGDAEGTVCMATLQEPGQLLHVSPAHAVHATHALCLSSPEASIHPRVAQPGVDHFILL